MIKQKLTPERAARVFDSVQFMHLMAELIKTEFQMHMDVNFKNPVINNFASRIVQSSTAIQTHLSAVIKTKDTDHRLEYIGELHRLFHLFIGLDLEQIKEFMDGAEAIAKQETEVVK